MSEGLNWTKFGVTGGLFVAGLTCLYLGVRPRDLGPAPPPMTLTAAQRSALDQLAAELNDKRELIRERWAMRPAPRLNKPMRTTVITQETGDPATALANTAFPWPKVDRAWSTVQAQSRKDGRYQTDVIHPDLHYAVSFADVLLFEDGLDLPKQVAPGELIRALRERCNNLSSLTNIAAVASVGSGGYVGARHARNVELVAKVESTTPGFIPDFIKPVFELFVLYTPLSHLSAEERGAIRAAFSEDEIGDRANGPSIWDRMSPKHFLTGGLLLPAEQSVHDLLRSENFYRFPRTLKV